MGSIIPPVHWCRACLLSDFKLTTLCAVVMFLCDEVRRAQGGFGEAEGCRAPRTSLCKPPCCRPGEEDNTGSQPSGVCAVCLRTPDRVCYNPRGDGFAQEHVCSPSLYHPGDSSSHSPSP